MTLHLKKLAVGVPDVGTFETWIGARAKRLRDRGEPLVLRHLTRHVPRRRAEVEDGGSLYWVVSGYLCVRAPIVAIEDVTDGDGKRCALLYEPQLIRTVPRRHRPFQGWRYLRAEDAPPDLDGKSIGADRPPEMISELKELGLL